MVFYNEISVIYLTRIGYFDETKRKTEGKVHASDESGCGEAMKVDVERIRCTA